MTEIINETIHIIEMQQNSFDLLAPLAINGPSHNFTILASQAGMCTLANISYCF